MNSIAFMLASVDWSVVGTIASIVLAVFAVWVIPVPAPKWLAETQDDYSDCE